MRRFERQVRRSVLVGGAAVLVLGSVLAVPSAAPAKRGPRPPRIASAVMVDANRDGRADRVRLTYSIPVRHALDRDGRYPFTSPATGSAPSAPRAGRCS